MRERIRCDLINYQKAHSNKWNQVLHYFAFLFAFLAWIFLFINVYVTICFGVLHYLLSWVGHFCFEGNKPASFKRPWLGFYAGFTWFFMRSFELVTGRRLLPK
ncbi:MAG: Mpo1-like protein [Bacillota bacterium]